MAPLSKLSVLVSGLACAWSAVGAQFENGIDSTWVETPQGKFECTSSKATNYLQVLRLAGRVIFQEQSGPGGGIAEDDTLLHGIRQENVGCPWVAAVRGGYVLIGRDVQPPAFGSIGYAVIDFNKLAPSLTELALGQRPQDDNISTSNRVEWSAKSLTLRLVGYTLDEQCCTVGAPKPRPISVRYTFESQRVEVVK
jgi:hypothetical protein